MFNNREIDGRVEEFLERNGEEYSKLCDDAGGHKHVRSLRN